MRNSLVLSLLALHQLSTGCGPGGTRGDGSSRGEGDDLATNGNTPTDGGTAQDLRFDNDAFWAQDPPPMYCALDGGAKPMVPGGTPMCPDDKNREGCACPKLGMTAPCWPGLRVNRNLGICMDGTTTCQSVGEVGQAWGPCMGYVLPTQGATSGKDACKCFSGGKWALDNLSPCLYDSGGGAGSAGATSSMLSGNMVTCAPAMGMLTLPNGPWTNDTVTSDCAGHFKLCYTLKAGDAMNPSPNDCVVGQSCVEADYTTVNQAQPFPPLPAWFTNDSKCAQKFAMGGYGEMSVDGISQLCDQVKKVFNRVSYCPLSCLQNPMDPKCKNCMQGGGGNF